MDLLLAALVASGFLGLTAHLVRRGRRARRPESAEPPSLTDAEVGRGWQQLRPRDVLIYAGRDLIVREVWAHREGAHGWFECRVDDEGSTFWVQVEGEETALVLCQPIESLAIGEEPPESLDHEGEIYRLERCGQARVSREGDTAFDIGYWDYRRPGSGRLWVRRRGADWRFLAGERIERHLVELLPGS